MAPSKRRCGRHSTLFTKYIICKVLGKPPCWVSTAVRYIFRVSDAVGDGLELRGASSLYFTFFDADGGRCFPGSGAPINFVQVVMHAINLSEQAKPACFAPPWACVAFSHKSISLSHLLRHALSGSCATAVPTRTVSVAANMQHRARLILISPPCIRYGPLPQCRPCSCI